MAGLIIAALALVISLAFNYLQYQWRNQDRQQHEQERAEAQAQRERQDFDLRRRERMPPQIYNVAGNPNPIRMTGMEHSVSGPFVDIWCGITVVNPTQAHMKIAPQRIVINGADWPFRAISFHLRANDRERYNRISMMGNEKQDYNLHVLFPEDKVPPKLIGELWLTSSNREDEPFSIPISFDGVAVA